MHENSNYLRMKANRILYVAKEVVPFTASSEMSEICRHLPQAIQERGHEIRTFMPKWGCINERRNQLHEVIRLSGMNLIIDETDHPLIIKVASLQMARMQVYFIDNEDYFRRKQTYCAEDGTFFADNSERTIFFARDVLEQPEIIDSFAEYRQRYEKENEVELPDQFDINEDAVKKQARSYKSVIKLDKNFHIYVHGDRKLIEQGEDEKGKFYKVYYKEES